MNAPFPVPLREQPSHPELTHVAIGVFDGFHRGHQQVVSRLVHAAGTPRVTAIITFEPHPLQIIAPERAPQRLTNARQKQELLLGAGVAEVITLHFDPETRDLSALDFINELLRIFPRLQALGMGPNWSFGKNRQGNASLLKEVGIKKGFTVHEVEPLCIHGEIASSTRIREAISKHDFTLAELLLGRSYAIEGTVMRGDGRGRTIGFPTANLGDVAQMIPPPGVYACRTHAKGQFFPSVLNIGRRPTFKTAGGLSTEVHLLDFFGDLYGQLIALDHFIFLRDELTFPNVESLREQITRDIVTARGVL